MLKSQLKKKLKEAKKIAFVGIGSQLRGDDAAGTVLAELLEKYSNEKFKVFPAASSPENITGQIKQFKPDYIIIADAAKMDEKPGTVKLFDSNESFGQSFSTHRMPIKLFITYLQNFLNFKYLFIAIQPADDSFGNNLSEPVLSAVKTLAEIFESLIYRRSRC
jgi:hydrogenase 3 maturation protease